MQMCRVSGPRSGRSVSVFFFFQAEDGIRDLTVTGVQTCALPICAHLLPDARGAGRPRRAALRRRERVGARRNPRRGAGRAGAGPAALEAIPGLDRGCRPARLRQVHVDRRAHHRGDQAALRALAPARDHGDDHRGAAGDPARRARGAQAGQLGGFPRPDRLDRRAGHALVLARHRLHPRPAHRLQVAPAHGLHAVLGQPVAEHAAAHLAGAGRGLPVLGGGDAHDALRDARGAARGLHPHGARQGALGAAHPLAPRAEERHAAGAHRDRARVRVPHGRARRHRAGLQPERARAPLRRGRRPPRLHAHPGAGDAGRVRLHLRQLPGRPGVRLARPTDPLQVMAVKPAALGEIPEVAERGGWRRAVLEVCRARPPGAIGAVVVLINILVGLGAHVIAPYDPLATDYGAMLARPSAGHWLGTDAFGRDVLSRIIYGSRTAMLVGFACAFLGATLGAVIGVTSAYFAGKVDLLIQRVMDIFLAFPLIILALAVVSILGTGIENVIMAITIPMIPRAALVARSSALAIREMPYVDAARAAGFSHRRIILRHMLPNVMAPYLIMLTAYLGQAILLEASLSFLGLGVAEPTPAWGLMLRGAAVQFAESAPWMAIFPGFAISLAVFAFNLFGDSLRDALDPRLRTQ